MQASLLAGIQHESEPSRFGNPPRFNQTRKRSSTVSVIDTTSNTVAATVTVGIQPLGVAVSPDGKHAYVANTNIGSGTGTGTVSVIDTTTITVAATVTVGSGPVPVSFAPDGKHVYVANELSSNVSVIDTTTNTVEATITVGASPSAVAFAPDGKHVYVPNINSNTVSVIDTTTNSVATTLAAGTGPYAVGIAPPPVGIPFLPFNPRLQIRLGSSPKTGGFILESSFTLGAATNGINPLTDPFTLQVGTFTTTIPGSSFKRDAWGLFTFVGVVGGVNLQVLITPVGRQKYAFAAAAERANLTGTNNPVTVTLTIGDNTGTTSVDAIEF
jgi:YVTN family beta-propeller protein